MGVGMDQCRERLLSLVALVAGEGPGAGEYERFADVSIVREAPRTAAGGFYPEDRYLVTRFPREVGWLFKELVTAFAVWDGYGAWKEELFGRLGNAANWYAARVPDASAVDTCLAVLVEALDIDSELGTTGGVLSAVDVGAGNQVLDDERDPLSDGRPTTLAEVRAHLRAYGADV